MADTNEYPHLKLTGREQTLDYTSPGGGGGGQFERPPRDRAAHAAQLGRDLDAAQEAASTRGLTKSDSLPLTYELRPEALELVESLERSRSGVQLLNVVKLPDRIRAVILVPPSKRRIIDAVLNRYANQLSKSGRPKGQDLVENIDAIRLASEQDLWTDSVPFPAAESTLWWEVWLHHSLNSSADKTWSDFSQRAVAAGLRAKTRHVSFPDRVVGLVFGSHAQWESDPRLFLLVAELRRAKELPTEYLESEPRFQKEMGEDLLGRMTAPMKENPAVCILDSGVAWGHPLLKSAIAEEDAQAIDPTWGAADNATHGSSMAGIALFGIDLAELLNSDERVILSHRLESVKILPPSGSNEPDAYGAITQEAVARAEIVAPHRRRAICLAVTADCRDGGVPSSWSAALDQLCFGGAVFGDAKLVCVSAGNLRDQIYDSCYQYPLLEGHLCGIEDPAQSWNAITVGAMTNRVSIQHPDFAGFQPVAPGGDLCPTSRTSLAWEQARGWPIKPDIVMEGGNWAKSPDGACDAIEDLGLLSTALKVDGGLFTIARDTSAATAAAARLAAQIMSTYPELWPETVRGLMVHCAQWTDAMKSRFPGKTKGEIQNRLRCYGYGQPELGRAIRGAANHVTLVYEGSLTPFKKDGSETKSNEMHLHNLPWPVEVLEQLGDESVTMRVTLSYFVDPSPGRRGWTRRHRYASHGLRFELQKPAEPDERFVRRISASALEEAEESDGDASGDRIPWVVGKDGRSQGSLHCDWWSGTAAELAKCRHLAVYPVTGWWRERAQLERWGEAARYSLIVSVESAEADIYAAIANELAIETGIASRAN